MSDIVSKNFGFSTPFLRGYNVLKIPIIDATGASAWPELFPPARIAELRDATGPRHFASQMLLQPVAPTRARLDPGALQLYDDTFDARTAQIGAHKITGAAAYWDPSSGRRGRDGSVCVILYRDDASRCIFIHDILYMTVSDGDTHPLAHQCDCVLEFLSRYNMRRITIETNGIGNALPEIMRDAATRAGTPITITRITNNRPKVDRILDAIEPTLAAGRLYAHRKITQTPFVAEMMGWSPIGTGHDDGLDAVAGAITIAPTPVRPAGHAPRAYTANTNFNV